METLTQTDFVLRNTFPAFAHLDGPGPDDPPRSLQRGEYIGLAFFHFWDLPLGVLRWLHDYLGAFDPVHFSMGVPTTVPVCGLAMNGTIFVEWLGFGVTDFFSPSWGENDGGDIPPGVLNPAYDWERIDPSCR